VINTAKNTVAATFVAGNTPRGVAVSPDGAYAYVSNRISDDVTIINTATNTVAATISGVAFLPEGIGIKP
jgi:YVTN family beta-propeller protein